MRKPGKVNRMYAIRREGDGSYFGRMAVEPVFGYTLEHARKFQTRWDAQEALWDLRECGFEGDAWVVVVPQSERSRM